MQPTTNRANVYDQFVHRRGGPTAKRAFYECRVCHARVHAVYRNGFPDLGRVRAELTRHVEACQRAA
jgi:hypothetical protein